MNIRATAHPMEPRAERSPGRAAAMEDATAVELAPELTVVFFDRPGPAGPARARLAGEIAGRPVPKPFIAASFDLRAGGQRHALFMGRGLDTVLTQPLRLLLDGIPAAMVDPGWLQPPVGELTALIEGLSDVGQRRLLRLLLTTGASLFAGASAAGLVLAVSRLMEICGVEAFEPLAVAGYGNGQRILTYRCAAAGRFMPLADPVALTPERAFRVKDVAAICETSDTGDLLHLQLPAAEGAELILFGDALLRLRPAPAALRRLPVPVWLEGRAREVRDWAFERIGGAAASEDRGAAALLRELAPGCAEPRLNILHLSATPQGLVHALELADPQRLIRAVVVERNGARAEIAPRLRVDGTGTLAGVLPLGGGPGAGEICRIRLLYQSGRLKEMASLPLQSFDGEIPAGFETAWRDSAASGAADPLRALAAARLTVVRASFPVFVQQVGDAAQPPALRIVTGLGDSPDMIRARAAMIFAEKSARRVEVVCTLAEGPLAAAARRVVEETVAIYGIPHRLVTLPDAASAGARLRAALAASAGAPVLALDSDVLPVRAGWLAPWVARLAASRAAPLVGAALLAGDGAIEDCGAGADGSGTCFRGLPASRLPVSRRRLARIPAACFGLSAEGVRQMLAAPLSHPDPEVLLAGLAVRQAVSARGLAMDGRHPFMRFGPAPDVTSFERALRAETLALIAATREDSAEAAA